MSRMNLPNLARGLEAPAQHEQRTPLVLRFAGTQAGPMLLQFPLNLDDDLGVIGRHVDLLSGVHVEVEEERRVVLFKGQRNAGSGVTRRRLKMRFEWAFTDGKQLVAAIIDQGIPLAWSGSEQN